MPQTVRTDLSEPFIVADIGGTHTRFARIDLAAGGLLELRALDTAAYASFEAALAAYFADTGGAPPQSLAIGAAGPLSGGRIALTNARWILDPPAIARAFALRSVTLANDLAAYAAGVAAAGCDGLICIAPAARPPEDVIIIAQGTGLGAAIIGRRSGNAEVFPTEAGHLSFAPETEEEDRLLRALRGFHPRPTFEHVASGSGLPDVYLAPQEKRAQRPENGAAVIQLARAGDAAAQAALRLAAGAVATFARTLVLLNGGAEAVVIGGGLGLALETYWRDSGFLARVCGAPAMPLQLGGLALFLAADPGLPLKGAAELARGRVACAKLARFP